MAARNAGGAPESICFHRLTRTFRADFDFMAAVQTGKASRDLQIFQKETLIKGRPARIACVEIGGQTFAIARGPVTVLRLEDEWYEDLRDPEGVIAALRNSGRSKPDIFTFCQRLPEQEPRHTFHAEWEEIAALPVQGFDHWWNTQIKGVTRNMVRKSRKAGIEVRESVYDDAFVRGMTDIFNESPVRQGRRFWHYGKSFEVVSRQFSRFLFRERLIGAYFQGELAGFAMLGNAGRFGDLGQIISKTAHRDKAINNALVAKAVELCARDGLPYLVYGYWDETSLAAFKRHSGFEKVRLPRYFVPLTPKGRMALKLGAHRGWKALLPDGWKASLKKLRTRWYELGRSGGTPARAEKPE